MKHLTSNDIKIALPDFSNSKLSKCAIVVDWLINWVKHALEVGIADFGDFIPTKEELAKFLGVSTSTIQNAIRQVKNLGYLCSKQSIGTYITDFYSKDIKQDNEILNTTVACCKIKKIILDEGIKLNTPILSIAELSRMTDISQNTIRFNLMELEQKGYLQRKKLRGNKYAWIYIKELELTKEEIVNGLKDENFTLTHQLLEKIQKYIEKTYKAGDKILPNSAFSRMFDVSVKTVNDAMKILNNKKIILSRRGKYGTIYLGNSGKNQYVTSERKQPHLAKYGYSWQKALVNLKKHIIENYKAGDKIASIRDLAGILNVSPNTIRRALKDLFENGYLISKRGKAGGIFIIEMPEKEQTYKWLSINPEVVDFTN